MQDHTKNTENVIESAHRNSTLIHELEQTPLGSRHALLALMVSSIGPIVLVTTLLCVLATSEPKMDLGLVLANGTTIFWPNVGGNNDEVYSHFLNVTTLSGTACAIAWILIFRPFSYFRHPSHAARLASAFAVASIPLLILGASLLDFHRGEGVVLVVYVFVAPAILLSALPLFKLSRQYHAVFRDAAIALVFAIGHFLLQLWYEPSHTGAPDLICAWSACLSVSVFTTSLYAAVQFSKRWIGSTDRRWW